MQIKNLGAVLLAAVSLGIMIGCDSGKPAMETASPKEIADLKTLRSIFDSVHGDYTQLSADQKKQFLDYSKGSEPAVERLWAAMKNPIGAGAPQHSPSGG